jgi:hypothetical protein
MHTEQRQNGGRREQRKSNEVLGGSRTQHMLCRNRRAQESNLSCRIAPSPAPRTRLLSQHTRGILSPIFAQERAGRFGQLDRCGKH